MTSSKYSIRCATDSWLASCFALLLTRSWCDFFIASKAPMPASQADSRPRICSSRAARSALSSSCLTWLSCNAFSTELTLSWSVPWLTSWLWCSLRRLCNWSRRLPARSSALACLLMPVPHMASNSRKRCSTVPCCASRTFASWWSFNCDARESSSSRACLSTASFTKRSTACIRLSNEPCRSFKPPCCSFRRKCISSTFAWATCSSRACLSAESPNFFSRKLTRSAKEACRSSCTRVKSPCNCAWAARTAWLSCCWIREVSSSNCSRRSTRRCSEVSRSPAEPWASARRPCSSSSLLCAAWSSRVWRSAELPRTFSRYSSLSGNCLKRSMKCLNLSTSPWSTAKSCTKVAVCSRIRRNWD
mmetsp:Transcript_51792/g.150582  ORF Transcript_51792/g.150582 Transcript_51792/m.150582 type:complete len:361 (+) Transcript_51792:3210-4292(+)